MKKIVVFLRYFPIGTAILLSTLLCCQTTGKRLEDDLPKEAGVGDARIILRYLLHGAVPNYKGSSSATEDLSVSEFCFARSHGSENEGKSHYDNFVMNTKAFLVPFAKGVKKLPVTERTFLTEDHTAEKWVYGDTWTAIVNTGETNFTYGQTLLPPMGFIAYGPDFLAQHYYAHIDDEQTALLILRQDMEFYAFR